MALFFFPFPHFPYYYLRDQQKGLALSPFISAATPENRCSPANRDIWGKHKAGIQSEQKTPAIFGVLGLKVAYARQSTK